MSKIKSKWVLWYGDADSNNVLLCFAIGIDRFKITFGEKEERQLEDYVKLKKLMVGEESETLNENVKVQVIPHLYISECIVLLSSICSLFGMSGCVFSR